MGISVTSHIALLNSISSMKSSCHIDPVCRNECAKANVLQPSSVLERVRWSECAEANTLQPSNAWE